MAGLVAETFGNWLEIEYLFVKENLRGQGIGSQLLQRAESEAKKRNCRYAFVNTYQFQAPALLSKVWLQGSFYVERLSLYWTKTLLSKRFVNIELSIISVVEIFC